MRPTKKTAIKPSAEIQRFLRCLNPIRNTPINVSVPADARCAPLAGNTCPASPSLVEMLRVAVALGFFALIETELGSTKQVGGSFTGTGETPQLRLTFPTNPFMPVTVMVEVPDFPAAKLKLA